MPRIVHQTRIDPAMLIHGVEPVYPTLPKQLGRAGRVELRAVIATGDDSVAASCERRSAFLPVRAGSRAPVALPAYGAKWRCGRDRHVHYGDLQHAALRRTQADDKFSTPPTSGGVRDIKPLVDVT